VTSARSVTTLALVIAGISWLIIWWHQHLTHGDTALNEENIVLGLTWMDSGKVLVLPLGLFFVAIVGLYWSMSQPGLPGTIGFAVSAGSLFAVIAGTALQFWAFDWGSYEEEFEEQAIGVGGALQAVATLVLALSLIVFGVALGRRRILSTWIAPALPISALATFYLTPTNPLPRFGSLSPAQSSGAQIWRV
jgi:hypothetical protein